MKLTETEQGCSRETQRASAARTTFWLQRNTGHKERKSKSNRKGKLDGQRKGEEKWKEEKSMEPKGRRDGRRTERSLSWQWERVGKQEKEWGHAVRDEIQEWGHAVRDEIQCWLQKEQGLLCHNSAVASCCLPHSVPKSSWSTSFDFLFQLVSRLGF